MKELFKNYFYYKYQAPNAQELIDSLSSYTEESINNDKFKWGNACIIDRVPLKREDYYNLLRPSLELLMQDFGSKFNYDMYDPWLNFYRKGSFQDIHDHSQNDLACVFFLNDGDGFSNLYFYDRNSISLSRTLKSLLKYRNIHTVDTKSGDIIFFPAHMMHGVTPHNSDVVRKTFVTNFNLRVSSLDRIRLI